MILLQSILIDIIMILKKCIDFFMDFRYNGIRKIFFTPKGVQIDGKQKINLF